MARGDGGESRRGFYLMLALSVTWLIVCRPLFTTYTISNNQKSILPFEQREGMSSNLPVVDPAAGSLQDEPWLALIGKSLREGSLPFVNVRNGLGDPLLASLQPGVLYPGNLLLLFLEQDSPHFFDEFQSLHVLVLLFGLMLLFMLYTSVEIAVALAISVGLSTITFYHINMVHFRAFVWTPYLAMLSVRIARGEAGKAGYFLLAGLIFTSVSAGNPQESFLGLLFSLVLYGAEVWAARRAGRPDGNFGIGWRVHGRFGAALLCGLLLCAPVLVPLYAAINSGEVSPVVNTRRVMGAIPPEWLTEWLFPRVNGLYPFFRFEVPLDLQPALAPLAILGIGCALFFLVVTWRSRNADVVRERVLLSVLFLFFALAISKLVHPAIFDLLQMIPIFNTIRYTKYTNYLYVMTGIVAAIGIETLLKKQIGRTVPVVVALLYLIAFWMAVELLEGGGYVIGLGERLPGWVYRDLHLTWGAYIFGISALALLLARGSQLSMRLVICAAAIISFLSRPSGSYRSPGEYLHFNSATDGVLEPARYSDKIWKNGVNRSDAGFFVDNEDDLIGLRPGMMLEFSKSGKRAVRSISGNQVWVEGPKLNPKGDGFPYVVRAPQIDTAERMSWEHTLATERMLSSTVPNGNLLSGEESIALFNPVHNRRYADFMIRHFALEKDEVQYQPLKSEPLSSQQLDVLRFLGVQAVDGYRLHDDAAAATRHYLDEALPRAFLVPSAILTETERLCEEGKFGELLKILNPHLVPVMLRQLNPNSFQLINPGVTRTGAQSLIVLFAYSKSWEINGIGGEPFCAVHINWPVQIESLPAKLIYRPAGLRLGIGIASSALVVLTLVVLVV